MHAILRESPRFRELITFAHSTDAKYWLLWQLSDPLALTSGAYCGFSIFMNRTPLVPLHAAKAFKAYRSYPTSPAHRRFAEPLLDAACKKLRTAGPSVDMLTGPSAPPTHPLLGPRDLGNMLSATEFFPSQPPDPQQTAAHARPVKSEGAVARAVRKRQTAGSHQRDASRRRAAAAPYSLTTTCYSVTCTHNTALCGPRTPRNTATEPHAPRTAATSHTTQARDRPLNPTPPAPPPLPPSGTPPQVPKMRHTLWSAGCHDSGKTQIPQNGARRRS